MCIFAKKFWLALAVLPVLALAVAGCTSSRSARPSHASRNSNSRLPQTGTNIPRRIHDEAREEKTKPRRTAKSKPAKQKGKSEKEKAKKSARNETDENVIIRGGFR